MNVEHHRLAFPRVHALNAAPDELEGRQAKISAAPNRKIHAEHTRRADWKFHERCRSVAVNLIGEPRRARLSVSVVQDRVDTRIVAKALFEQDLVRPGLRRVDREVRSAVADNRRTDQIFEPRSRAADVASKFPGSLTTDVFVPIPVAGNLVPFHGDPAHQRRVRFRDRSQREERRPGVRCCQQCQEPFNARLHAALEAPLPVHARCQAKYARVEVFLHVHAESVHDHSVPVREWVTDTRDRKRIS